MSRIKTAFFILLLIFMATKIQSFFLFSAEMSNYRTPPIAIGYKSCCGNILDDYDAVMRSIIVGIYELGIEEIMLIHHTDCGAGKLTGEHMEYLIRERIAADKVAEVEQHIDLRQWLDGFGDTEKSVRATMRRVKNHPLVPDNIIVRGFIIDSTTGALTEIEE